MPVVTYPTNNVFYLIISNVEENRIEKYFILNQYNYLIGLIIILIFLLMCFIIVIEKMLYLFTACLCTVTKTFKTHGTFYTRL